MPKLHQHFDSTIALANWTSDKLIKGHNYAGYISATSVNHGIESLRICREQYVDKARVLLAKFTESIEVRQQVWSHSVAGYFPDVPAYLAGDPENMFVREFMRSDQTPLHCYIGVSVISNTLLGEMITRGIALSSFAMAMIQRRPVIITPFVDLGGPGGEGAVISWDISTQPLVLGELLTSMIAPEVTRDLGIFACYALNPKVTGHIDPDSNYEDRMRIRLNAKPQDLYLQCVNSYNDPIIDDPIEWIKQQTARYGEDE